MSAKFNRFRTNTVLDSITNPNYTVDGPTPADNNKPYTLTQWITQTNQEFGSPEQFISIYNEYLREWYDVKQASTTERKASITLAYQNLLREIVVKYSTDDEKRFLTNIDYTNKNDLDIAIPFFSKKLKDVILYLAEKRDTLQFEKTKNSLAGSVVGIERLTYNIILDLLQTEKYIDKYKTALPALSTLSRDLDVQLDEYYDDDDTYYDIDPSQPKTTYTGHISGSLRDELFHFQQFEYDPQILVEFDSAVIALIESYPTYIETGEGLLEDTTGELISVPVETTIDDIDTLPDTEFFDYVTTKDTLNLHTQKEYVERFIGSPLYYLSGGSTANINITGALATPSSVVENILTRYHPTANFIPNDRNYKIKQEIGGYFTPTKLGVQTFVSLEHEFEIDLASLSANQLITLPNIYAYGLGRGLSKSDHKAPVKHFDDVRWVKADKGNSQFTGDIVNSKSHSKFFGYQSKIESNKYPQFGISRNTDRFDFWTGAASDIWANQDIYPITEPNTFDLESRFNTLLVKHKDVTHWRTDIYGNEYALFKHIMPSKVATSVVNNTSTTLCDIIDGNTFIDPVTLSTIVANQSVFGGALSSAYGVTDELVYGGMFTPYNCTEYDVEEEEFECQVYDGDSLTTITWELTTNLFMTTLSANDPLKTIGGMWHSVQALSPIGSYFASKLVSVVSASNVVSWENYTIPTVMMLSGNQPPIYNTGDEFPYLTFDSTKKLVNTIALSTYDFTKNDPLTILIYFKTTDTAGNKIILSKQEDSGTFTGYSIFHKNGQLEWTMKNNAGGGLVVDVDTGAVGYTPVNDGNWHLAAVTYNGVPSATETKIYVDGVSLPTIIAQDNLNFGGGDTLNHVSPFQINGRDGNDTRTMSMDMYFTAIIPRALSGHEIALYNSYTRSITSIFYDEVVDGGPIIGHPCDDVFNNDLNIFEVDPSTFQLTSSRTVYSTASSGPVAEKSIYNKRYNTLGELWFRNLYSNKVMPGSAVFTSITNRPSIYNNLIGFDVIYDLAIFETKNEILFDRITYDYTSGRLLPSTTNNLSITSADSDLEKVMLPFFNDANNILLTGRTLQHPVSSDIVYTELHAFDLDKFVFKQAFPVVDTDFEVSQFALPTSLSAHIIKTIDYPLITYNETLKKYNVTYKAFLSSPVNADVFAIFTHNYKYDGLDLKVTDTNVYVPTNLNVPRGTTGPSSTTLYLAPTAALSALAAIVVSGTPVSSVAVSGTGGLSGVGVAVPPVIGCTGIPGISSFNYTLTIVPSGVPAESRVKEIIYSFGDGTIKRQNRELLMDLEYTTIAALSTLIDIHDATDPRLVPVSHTYTFGNSSIETLFVGVSVVYHNFLTRTYCISAEVYPSSLVAGFGDMHVINTRAYSLSDQAERVLMALETETPRYVTNATINNTSTTRIDY